MKLKVDSSCLVVFGKVCQYNLNSQFEDVLFQFFFHSTLRALIIKLAKANERGKKRTVLHLTLAEIMAYKWAIEFWNNNVPATYEYHLSMQYFVQPLIKSYMDKLKFIMPATGVNAQA